jgi:hypothetical protein
MACLPNGIAGGSHGGGSQHMVVDFSLNMLVRGQGGFKLLRNQAGFSRTVLARPLLTVLTVETTALELAARTERSHTSTSTDC